MAVLGLAIGGCSSEETFVISKGSEKGTFNFNSMRHPAFRFSGARSRVLADGRWTSSVDYPEQKVAVSKDGRTLTFLWSGLAGAPDLETNFFDCGCSALEITSRAVSKDSAFTIGGFELVCCLPEDGCDFTRKLASDEEVSFLLNGYQSWSYSGVVKPGSFDGARDEFPFWANNGDMLNIYPALSWWYGAIHLKPKRETLMLGALTSEVWKSFLAFYRSGDGFALRLVNGATGDTKALEAGAAMSSETNYMKWGVLNRPLDAYAEKVAEKTPPLGWKGDVPKGWNSWYELYANVTAENVLANARLLKQEFSSLGFDLVQIDDGWEKTWGDWTANDKFPQGMDGIASSLAALGLKAGLWVAPFMVVEEAPLAAEHPDWFVVDSQGDEPLYYLNPGQTDRHLLLDVTNSEAAQWLRGVFEGLRKDGYTFFKIDFLFGGAYEGGRKEEVTSMEAYHRGLQLIREAVGEDAFILACGAPILPTAGHAHANRIGPDIAFQTPGPSFTFIAHQARNSFTRYFLGRLHMTDPDEILAREPLSDDEAAAAAALGLVAGAGMVTLGDDLTRLSSGRMAVLKKILSHASGASGFKPFDLFEHADQEPSLSPLLDYVKNLNDPGSTGPSAGYVALDDGLLLCLFNWTDTEKEYRLDLWPLFDVLSLFLKAEVITGSEITRNGTAYSVEVRPHGVWLGKVTGK